MSFDMSLIGVKKNIPQVNFTDYTGIIVGFPKFGKTTMASLFPKSIIVPFEIGFKSHVVNYADGINTWEDFIDFIDKLEKHRAEIGDNIQTLVFDTVNEAYEKCLPYMLKQEGRKSGTKYTAVNDIPYGQGWAKWDEYFKRQIDRIQKLGFSILFISHSKVKTIKPKSGEPYDVYSSTMSDRLEKMVYPLVDYIIFGEKQLITDPLTGNTETKRVMVVSGNENSDTEAGGRVSLKANIVFDTEEEAVEKFQAHFEEAIQEKLKKAGVVTDINTLKKQQSEEKAKGVQKYIETQNQPTKEEVIEQIKTSFVKANAESKAKVADFMKENGIVSLSNTESIDIDKLQEIIKLLS